MLVPIRIPVLAALAAIVVFAIGNAAPAGAPTTRSQPEFEHSVAVLETKLGKYPISVEIADTPEKRSQGLQYRRALASDAGMLFDFRQTRRIAMWMKNTSIPLDMIFIDDQGQVIGVETHTTPFSLKTIWSSRPARAVLEVNAGLSDRIGLRAGDAVCHSMFERTHC